MEMQTHDCVTSIMSIRTCGICVVQAIAGSYDDNTIAHLCYIAHVPHDVTGLYDALLLKLSVKDQDSSVIAAAPELLVDDAQSFT